MFKFGTEIGLIAIVLLSMAVLFLLNPDIVTKESKIVSIGDKVECASSGNVFKLEESARWLRETVQFEFMKLKCTARHLHFTDARELRPNLAITIEGKLSEDDDLPRRADFVRIVETELVEIYGVQLQVQELTIGDGYLWPSRMEL